MSKQIDLVNSFISQGKIKKAISELGKVVNREGAEDLKNEIIALSAKFNNNEKQKRIGVVSEADYQLKWNRILASLTSLVQEYQEGVISCRTVFISYSRKDEITAFKLKDALESRGLNVIIDVESIRPGDDIKEFIEESIANSNVTLSVVSNASLLSSWVGMETINTFFDVKIKKDRQFIACYLDDDFFNRDFTLNGCSRKEKVFSDCNIFYWKRLQINVS